MTDTQHYLRATPLLDYTARELVTQREHLLTNVHSDKERLKLLYGFVSALPLGYNANDDIAASRVLKDGYGQCNTKVTLLCALARGAGIATRIHAHVISRDAQRGRVPDWLLRFAPPTTIFFWPEFLLDGTWTPLQRIVHSKARSWDACPFDGARYQLEPLRREWIVKDLGRWASPDDFFAKHKPSVYGWRTIGWKLLGRRVMQRRARMC